MSLLDEARIKAAMLHPEAEVRERALRFFCDHASDDPTVMPAVIEAVDRYGLDEAWRMLLSARELKQTPATLDWALAQLDRPFDLDEITQDNQHYALAWLVVEADPALLGKRYEQVVAVPELPERLRQVLEERLELHRSSWAACWAQFEAFGLSVMEADAWSIEHHQRAGRLIAALAHHGRGRRDAEKFVLNLVRRQYPKAKRELYELLECEITRLAGRMQLTQAVPLLVRRLLEEEEESEDLALTDAVTLALSAIGTDAVAKAIAHAWWQAEAGARISMAGLLGDIRSELSAERCLAFFHQEEEEMVLQSLAQAMLRQFNTDAVEPVADLVADEELFEHDAEWRDVRLSLVEAATIMDVRFPAYDRWYAQAREETWGWRRSMPEYRLREGMAGFTQAMQNEALEGLVDEPDPVWRMKVTLLGVDPPVWRRLELPDCPLDELHLILQTAFGWEDAHLYAFHVGGVEYGDPELYDEPPAGDATATWLSDVVQKAGDRLTYVYDFGDHWEHAIVIEQVQETDDPYLPPRCLAGELACPPEDVGGPPGYAAYLGALADPQHEAHADMLAWNGDFDPDAFDLDAVNAELRKGFDEWERQITREVDAVEAMLDEEALDDPDEMMHEMRTEDAAPLALADNRSQYLIGTIAHYGPDAKTTTKIVAGVSRSPDDEPLLQRWVGTNVVENERVQQEIQAFFKEHAVKQVVATEGNLGCPHEEGEDFPEGEDCPFCPYWRGRQ